jgi:hypothetical protein
MVAMDKEKLGPAERIIRTMTPFVDHVVHHRTGIVRADPGSPVGVKWDYAKFFYQKDANTFVKTAGAKYWQADAECKVVCLITSRGKHDVFTPIGVLQPDGKTVKDGAAVVGEYRAPGFFVEVTAWLYKQVAEVWSIDNEFVARWASYAWAQKHEDMKVILAAFLLVQSRAGEAVKVGGSVAFYDEDFREVGEAMLLLGGAHNMSPKLVDRVRSVLRLPEIAEINRQLGFGKSARRPETGRYDRLVRKWLRHREQNVGYMHGLVKGGWRQTVIKLAKASRYVPLTPEFYKILGWKQEQAEDGRRKLHIGGEVRQVDSWEGLTEAQVCERVERDKPAWNLLSGILPPEVGLTKAVMASAIDAGCVSSRELVILGPTIEELGLLKIQKYRERLDKALAEADSMRAANIARRMKSTDGEKKMEEAAEKALQKDVAEVVRGVLLYFFVDISTSMTKSIPVAMQYIARLAPAFPLDRLVPVVFRETARALTIKHASKEGVEHAFRGVKPEGGTEHAQAVIIGTSARKPGPDEDAIFLWIGDGGETDYSKLVKAVRSSGVMPVAFGFLELPGQNFGCIRNAAADLGIPLFNIDERIFGQAGTGGTIDPYAIARSLRAIISAAPVGQRTAAAPSRAPQKTLVDEIIATELLKLPEWAVVLQITRGASDDKAA